MVKRFPITTQYFGLFAKILNSEPPPVCANNGGHFHNYQEDALVINRVSHNLLGIKGVVARRQ